jgi:hypothetical protein
LRFLRVITMSASHVLQSMVKEKPIAVCCAGQLAGEGVDTDRHGSTRMTGQGGASVCIRGNPRPHRPNPALLRMLTATCLDDRFCQGRVLSVSDRGGEGQSSAFCPGLGESGFAQAAAGQGHGRFVARPVGQGDA